MSPFCVVAEVSMEPNLDFSASNHPQLMVSVSDEMLIVTHNHQAFAQILHGVNDRIDTECFQKDGLMKHVLVTGRRVGMPSQQNMLAHISTSKWLIGSSIIIT